MLALISHCSQLQQASHVNVVFKYAAALLSGGRRLKHVKDPKL